MKTSRLFSILLTCILISSGVKAQEVNWKSLKPTEQHLVHANAGFENGVVFGVGYHYRIRSKIPLMLGGEYSFPAGKTMLDDFKTRIGAQVRILPVGNFQLSAKVQGLYRQYQNNMVAMKNFGCYLSGTLGFYQHRWFAAGEFGFDKAIVTHFKHSDLYKQNFPQVQNGWYEPATGGNYNYGLLLGYSFKQSDLSLRAGKLLAEDFKTDPFVPFYAQLGYVYKIGR